MKVRKTKMLAAALAATSMLTIAPATASAKWYMNRAYAEQRAHTTVTDLYGDYGVYSPTVSCRRQSSRNQGAVGSMSHRWVCGWADYNEDGATVGGQVAIIGTDGSWGFFYRVSRGIHYI
jgi:hypothetical protein